MKEFRLGISTNGWNALRYALFTLILIPLAEKLWARTHSKRTGKRILRGRKARLRGSRLAHWGLHQEVGENSRLSKVSAIAVCVLHIAGALLLEYGSGSLDTYVMHDAVLSRTLRDEGGLRSNGIYFFDAGYVLGKPYGSIDCIDGEPRTLEDFGLELKRRRRTRIVPFADLPARRNAERQVHYYVPNSGRTFLMFDNGNTRWFEFHEGTAWIDASQFFSGFENKSVSCLDLGQNYIECYENEANLEQAEFLSDILRDYLVSEAVWINFILGNNRTKITVNLRRVSVTSERNLSRQAEAVVQTAWVRHGMPRAHIPPSTFMNINLNITELRDGCERKHAIPVSNLRKLEGLKVSRPAFPSSRHIWKGDHKPIVWMNGNRLAPGTLTHSKNEYCALRRDARVCVTLGRSGKHELVLYQSRYDIHSSEKEEKLFNVSVQGLIRKRDALDLVVQSCAEANRLDSFKGVVNLVGSEKRIARLIRTGKIVAGLVRLSGKGMQGKSTLRKSNVATINIPGLVGTTILLVLLVAPIIPMLFNYREGFVADIESSFKRAVMEVDGVQNCREVPARVPTIVSKYMGDGTHAISHTYKM